MQHLFLFGILHYIKYTNSNSCGADSDMALGLVDARQRHGLLLFLRALLPTHSPLQVRQLKAECSGQNL